MVGPAAIVCLIAFLISWGSVIKPLACVPCSEAAKSGVVKGG